MATVNWKVYEYSFFTELVDFRINKESYRYRYSVHSVENTREIMPQKPLLYSHKQELREREGGRERGE